MTLPIVRHVLALAILLALIVSGGAQPVADDGTLVQISSQRSEADALASFRALQEKYPDFLGGRSPVVKRADLAAAGTYYRVYIGPFPTEQDATQFCTKLQAAGGACFIPRRSSGSAR